MVEALDIETGFQKTEIGIFPADWNVVELGKVASFRRGSFPQPYGLSKWYDEQNGMPFVQVYDVDDNMKLKPETKQKISDAAKDKSVFVPRGSIVLTIQGSIGRIAITQYDSYVDRTLLIFKSFLVPMDKWYFMYIVYQKFQIEKPKAPGGTIKTITKEELSSFKIPIPPTEAEQTAIANALNDVDKLIAELGKLIAKKRNIRQGAMQELLRPKDGWAEKTLGEIADVIGGGTPSTFNSKYWNGEINWFTPTEVGDKKYSFHSVRKITNEGLKNCSARILPVGTILLTSRASIGDASILMQEGCTNQGFQSLIVKDENSNEFLYYLILTLKPALIQKSSGSTFLEISPSKLKAIDITIPNPTEQKQIAQILLDMDAEIEALEKKLEKQKMLKEGMMQNLLTGKIRLIKYGIF